MEAQKPNTPQKPVAAKSAKTQGEHKVRGIKNAFLVIVCCACSCLVTRHTSTLH